MVGGGVCRPMHPQYSSIFVTESNTEYGNMGVFVSLRNLLTKTGLAIDVHFTLQSQ